MSSGNLIEEEKKEDEILKEEESLTKKNEESYKIFQEKLKSVQNNEDKLQIVIEFMKKSLSQEKIPDFKGFWDAKKICLDLFKENLNPIVRTKYWKEYLDLSDEAKRVKDILDEQASFAKEQIELAVEALEEDIKDFNKLLQQLHPIEIPESCKGLLQKQEFYQDNQKLLTLLNTFAARINSLRREVIKVSIRIRYKNKFFKRLSAAGDQVFPNRKELIKDISEEFEKDIDSFVDRNFSEDNFGRVPFYLLRDEIKSLQYIAKELTLNTKCFLDTRRKLSGCWDKLKAAEKGRREKYNESRKQSKENFDLVKEKIDEFAKQVKDGMSSQEADKQADEILKEMRDVELVRPDVLALKSLVKQAKAPIVEEEKRIQEERFQKEKEKLAKKKERFQQLQDDLNNLLSEGETLEVDALSNTFNLIKDEIKDLGLNKIEKQLLDRKLKPVKDLIADKKEKAVLDLSEDELKDLAKLKDVLDQRKARRVEIKKQLEKYRKALGGSGFDFEKAMMYNEFIEIEKQRLENADKKIEEIEAKISELEG
jgi:hypothetical protein